MIKCHLIIKKGEEIKKGKVTVNKSMKAIAQSFKREGWKILYFKPIGYRRAMAKIEAEADVIKAIEEST